MPLREQRRGRAAPFAVVVVLAVALAYIEASVVVYLREVLEPVRRAHFPAAAREPLPLLTPQQLKDAGNQFASMLLFEVARELTPIVVLLAMAWAAGRRLTETVAFFLIGFAVWDVFYYVFLKVLLDWPASLATWDVLFLIPTAWVAPVWAPLAVSATLLLTGLGMLASRRPDRAKGRRKKGRPVAWLAIAAGVGLVLASFFLRTNEAFARVPSRFDWQCFLAGWLLGAAGIVWLLWTARHNAHGQRPRITPTDNAHGWRPRITPTDNARG